MLITVTQEHIDCGVAGAEEQCPVALAMLEAGLGSPSVGGDYAEWSRRWGGTGPNAGYVVDSFTGTLPTEAADFVERFDEERPTVRPFSFRLTPDAD